jgi:hypothetical protein
MRPPFVIGGIKKMSKEAYDVWLLALLCKMVKQVYIDYTSFALFRKRWVLQCPPLVSSCLFLVVT